MTILEQTYIITKRLGHGEYGAVFLAHGVSAEDSDSKPQKFLALKFQKFGEFEIHADRKFEPDSPDKPPKRERILIKAKKQREF